MSRTAASAIAARVCNEHRNSDLRADDPAIIAAFDAEIERLTGERDEALALNRQAVCVYCGHVEAAESREQLRDVMARHIEGCASHPLNRVVEIVNAATVDIETARDAAQAEAARLRTALVKVRPALRDAIRWMERKQMDPEWQARMMAVIDAALSDTPDPAKIDAALKGVRAAIAGDPEAVEALDAVPAASEDLTPATVREIVAELGDEWHQTLTTHLESNLCHPKRDQFICIRKDRGWTLFDGDGNDIARGTTIAQLRDALAAPVPLPQRSDWNPEATC